MLSTFTEYGYAGIFAVLILSGFGLPIPEELPVLTAGMLVGHGDTHKDGEDFLDPHRLRWYIMLPVCILGVVVGDGVLYTIGRLWGPRLLNNAWVKRRLVPPEKRDTIIKNFHDRGIMILLTARLTPGIRSPIFIMAGVLRIPLSRFLLADGLYAIPGVSAMFFLAYVFTDQVFAVYYQLTHYKSFVIVGVLSAITGIILYRFFVERGVATGEHSQVPTIVRPMEMVTEAATHAVEATMNKAVKAVGTAIDAVTHRGQPTEKPDEKPPEPEAVVR